MPKATLMIRFKRPTDSSWQRKPAAIGSTGRVRSGYAVFKDRETGQAREEHVGERYTFDIRIEDGATRYEAAGSNGVEALARLTRVLARLKAQRASEALGLVVMDPEKQQKKRVRLRDSFDDYIQDAEKRGASEAREQAILVRNDFLRAVSVVYVDEVTRDRILDFDQHLRSRRQSDRTVFNKRQRLQSMLRWAGVDPGIFPPKPRFEKKLPTIYTPEQLAGLFAIATPHQRTVCSLMLKLGLRDQEVQFAEFADVIWHESVFRVQSKPHFHFRVKDCEERDIPIPTDFLEELKAWREQHPDQNLIVPTSTGKPNCRLLPMVKRMAKKAGCNPCWGGGYFRLPPTSSMAGFGLPDQRNLNVLPLRT